MSPSLLSAASPHTSLVMIFDIDILTPLRLASPSAPVCLAATGENAIVNPGFESGAFSPWLVIKDTGMNVNIYRDAGTNGGKAA